jgi:hypothetical protein
MTSTQQTFPEIEAAAQALEKRIAITEAEIAMMKEDMAARKRLVRSWRKALSAFAPQANVKKKRGEKLAKSAEV